MIREFLIKDINEKIIKSNIDFDKAKYFYFDIVVIDGTKVIDRLNRYGIPFSLSANYGYNWKSITAKGILEIREIITNGKYKAR